MALRRFAAAYSDIGRHAVTFGRSKALIVRGYSTNFAVGRADVFRRCTRPVLSRALHRLRSYTEPAFPLRDGGGRTPTTP